jgi:hypothetical protein
MSENKMLYVPPITCSEKEYCNKWEGAIKANQKHLEDIENKAIASGKLLYRFIYEPVADGQAIYQIIRVNKNTVKIRLCQIDPLYADYVVNYWGKEATIKKEYAEQQIRSQDALRQIFAIK